MEWGLGGPFMDLLPMMVVFHVSGNPVCDGWPRSVCGKATQPWGRVFPV